MRIRPAVPDDAPALVALRAVVYPYLVRGVEATRQLITQPPPDQHWTAYVAETEERLVGWAAAHLNSSTVEPGVGEISLLHVHPEFRRRGTGSALLAKTREHLLAAGACRVRTWALAESLDFARRRGLQPSREVRYSALELRPAPAEPPVPSGVELVPVADLDPRGLHAAEAAATADEPGDVPKDAISYPAWRHDVWDNLGLDRAASVAAVVDAEVVAFSLVQRDGDRMWSDMTATRPEYRGRGLARLVKLAALHRAAARGARMAYTSNDEANAPMLAINTRLGYRPVGTHWSCLGTLA